MKERFCRAVAVMLLAAAVLVSGAPAHAGPDSDSGRQTSGKVVNNDLSKAVESQGKEALKTEVSRIGGGIVNSVRALFITFFAVAVIFMGLQAAGGGLKDPRKVELIKGGGISAAISAVLVYKAEAIVAFILNIVGVDITELLK
ncbi:MAG: hypothetical protein K6T66_12935 [Peptococcaceae bacterium]|nr:hypothetical protein [Peptococcaceae bacterium]